VKLGHDELEDSSPIAMRASEFRISGRCCYTTVRVLCEVEGHCVRSRVLIFSDLDSVIFHFSK
jgi:hypothetical protein